MRVRVRGVAVMRMRRVAMMRGVPVAVVRMLTAAGPGVRVRVVPLLLMVHFNCLWLVAYCLMTLLDH